ncbi:hypothetical protein DICVIV_04800 [Dictyocaulus viviparus]|uniref:Uncharacterized protein n=1 Tax=Dictyocaulus viviparus TaxID=29172 RepID=A0A0D8XWQ0_DICVI|nr:hypothetical protein DICVIV_04800 [Dictyocaulus viviparus]
MFFNPVKRLIYLGNCILPRQAWRFDFAIKKNFQRLWGKKLGLEDRILLKSLGQHHRHLDERKVIQLSKILQEKLVEAVSTSEELSLSAIEFTKKLEQSLENQRHLLRRILSELIGTNCPELHFIADRSRLVEQEMDRLFRIADYGMDYRALSHTGRVLGNTPAKKLENVESTPDIEVRPLKT